MAQKWIKRVSWILLTPILLFAILMALLYVPPVQNFLRGQATAYASQAIGMQINVGRIDLRFPLNLLVRDVEVIQKRDTLLAFSDLNVHIQALPLLRGQIEIDGITLRQVFVNSNELIKGLRIRGFLGRFVLESHGIDLANETVLINHAALSDTHVEIILADTLVEGKDTTKATINWNIDLHALKLKNVSFGIQIPSDSMRLTTRLGEATAFRVFADLKRQSYGLKTFQLEGASFNYNVGKQLPSCGFDPSHIAFRDIRVGIDSVRYSGRSLNAVVRELSMNERSGISVTSLTGKFNSDSTLIRLPRMQLRTPNSEINLSGQGYWELMNIPTSKKLTVQLDAFIGKQDVMLLAGCCPDANNSSRGGLPKLFWDAYPFRPLVVQASTEGNLKQMQLSRFRVDLPGAFSIDGGGDFYNLTDSLARSGTIDLQMRTENLNFLTALADLKPSAPLTIPNGMNLDARFSMRGPSYDARLSLKEGSGTLNVAATLNSTTEVYDLLLKVDALQVNHFLPKDSIYTASASLLAKGRGFAPTSYRSFANFKVAVDQLHYGRYQISGIYLDGGIKNAVATAHLISDNVLLKMNATAEYHLAHRYPDGKVQIDVERISLYELGLIDKPLKRPLAFNLSGEVRKERVFTHLVAGDLKLNLNAHRGLIPLIKQSTQFADILMKQLDEKELNNANLRKLLPEATLSLSAEKENPLSWFLATKNIFFNDLSFDFNTTPNLGINGKTFIHTLKIDTLQLDTICFTIKQDTSCIRFFGSVINGPKNPKISFRSTLTGELRDKDAELTAQYMNAKGEIGLLFGVNARPLTGGNGKGDGVAFSLIPAEPIIAFHRFTFVDHCNWVYLHKNKRVYANVDMQNAQGVRIRVQSNKSDTVSLQNMDVEVQQLYLADLFSILPYAPQLTGILSAEAHYVQTENSLVLSAEAGIDELAYEHQRIGDIALGASWLPGEQGKQYVNAYLTHEDVQILTANGTLHPTHSGEDSIAISSTLEHFPVSMVNALIPNRTATLSGDVDGNLHIVGTIDQPLVRGQLILDSVSVYARQADARFRFDSRPVELKNSRLVFDKFSIFTTGKNPFVIDGYVDFHDLNRPFAHLDMKAVNYMLLNAKRTKESMVYGKVFVDFDATARGALNALVVRGNVNLLGNTDVTYVLMDSPLTVQDRLGNLVTFTSFNDTVASHKEETPAISLGGIDAIMNIQIEPAVQLKADLSADRSSRVLLEGGGSLSMKYTPQGDLTLSGRYTLTGGMMKYALPVIPLKEFQITNGSYVEWTGNPMDPLLNLKATERVRTSVAQESGGSRVVNFDISIVVKNRLDNISLSFEIDAPEDAAVQNQLASMGPDERSKQAIAMLATGIYLADSGGTGGFNMGAALNSVLASQINALTENMKNTSISVGVENHDDTDVGGKRVDYSFRYSRRFFNNRFQIVLGGKVSTGANVTNDAESFIDNISLEYRLDTSGTRYVRLFHDKNYESILEGEITETGIGLVLRKKLDRLSELFIFKRKKKEVE